MSRERSRAFGLAVLATIAYVPTLLSSPGRMPADTKLYLYLDPGGLLARASSTFEPDQFAGWVPHQQITYLWPSGPWFWCFDAIGVPDWIAHRAWIGTILFAAGTGVWWAARRLGLGLTGALVAGVFYATTPYLLAYVSRTSLLLLPWAGLGWIVGLTMIAVADQRQRTQPARDVVSRLLAWRAPAAIALVVGTVGSVNATALALIVPAPLLWLVTATRLGTTSVRDATAIALRTGLACTLISLWWVGMLVVQARFGAPVLSYSETLEDVSRNSTGSEVLRTLGYWLFYQRDPFGPTTTASLSHLMSTRTIVVSFLVVLVGLTGIVVVRWAARTYAALLVGVGAVLGVGVHPYDDPSPLMALIAGDGESGLALALRSSTRAVPVLVFGLALGAGALVGAISAHRPLTVAGRHVRLPARAIVALAIAGLLLANLPVLRTRGFVDPAIDREASPPAAWSQAGSRIDEMSRGGRVLQLPGAEFGAFRWGYTADQPLVGMADTPLVTRDLLPLGSAGAMDLLYALDDRFQQGVAEAGAVAAVARRLGASTILLTNDMEFERYQTARPEIVDALLTGPGATGLTDVERIGEPVVNEPAIPMIDPTSMASPLVGEAINPLTVLRVDEPIGVVRAATRAVIVSGSGDGIVDAAAAGLIDDDVLIRYSASLEDDDLVEALATATGLIVTDSNRDRAHHWRSSQDVHGHTEPGGPDRDVLDPTPADQRLELFDTDDPATQTIAEQEGPVRATASSYGEPFAYRPEHRAVMAIDGDPLTAWTVADHDDPVGERIRLEVAGMPDEVIGDAIVLTQVAPMVGGRVITAVRVTVDDGTSFVVDLGPESTTTGTTIRDQRLVGTTSLELRIDDVSVGDPAVAASRRGVGFTEIDLGLDPTTEIIRVPTDGLVHAVDVPVTLVLTRLRTDPTDPWRSDPEPILRRRFVLPTARTMSAAFTIRLDARASDTTIAELAGTGSATTIANRRLTGALAQRGAAATDGDASTAWITPFDQAVGSTLTFTTSEELHELAIVQPSSDVSRMTAITLSDGTTTVEAEVPRTASGAPSTIAVPGGIGPGTLTLSIADIEPVPTIDRRYGDQMILPAGVAELTGAGIPVEWSTGDDTTVSDECISDLVSIDGVPVPVRLLAPPDALLRGDAVAARTCGDDIEFAAGDHVITAVNARGLLVDRVVLSDDTSTTSAADAATAATAVTARVTRDAARSRTVVVDHCTDGCWLVLGEGFNPAWSARTGVGSLGPPTMVDGGFNGWWIAPSDGTVEVEIQWTAQRLVSWGIIVSVLAAIAAIAIVLLTARRPVTVLPMSLRSRDRSRSSGLPGALVTIAAAGVLIGPLWAVAAAVPAGTYAIAAATVPSATWWRRIPELSGLAAATYVAGAAVIVERRTSPLPNAGWTVAFEHLNGFALFAVVLIAVGCWQHSRDVVESDA